MMKSKVRPRLKLNDLVVRSFSTELDKEKASLIGGTIFGTITNVIVVCTNPC